MTAISLGAHWIIEGRTFANVRAIYRYAKAEKGYKGTERCLQERVKRGARTWKEIAAPSVSRNTAKMRAYRVGKREEMRAMCAVIDSRKVKY